MRKTLLIILSFITISSITSQIPRHWRNFTDGFNSVSKDHDKFDKLFPCYEQYLDNSRDISNFVGLFNHTKDYKFVVDLFKVLSDFTYDMADFLSNCPSAYKQVDSYVMNIIATFMANPQDFVNKLIENLKSNPQELVKESIQLFDYYRKGQSEEIFYYYSGKMMGYIYNRIGFGQRDKIAFLK